MNLLVATDGSDESNAALRYATTIASATDGSITVLHAIDPSVYESGGMEPITTFSDAEQRVVIEGIEAAEDRGERVLEEAITLAEEYQIDVEGELMYGNPITVIPSYAEDHEIDTIYVGHRGRSERLELLLGSVAKAIVERSTVPVTVVR